MIALYIALGLIGLVVLLLLIALVKTLCTPKKTDTWQPKRDEKREDEYARTLSKMVQYDTVSRKGVEQREKFLGYHKLLEELFPLVHANLEKTEINGNLLYYWKGKSSERPALFLGHQDVVPAEGEWEHEYFGGEIEDGKVWGRGACDTKCSVMAFFQAVEELLKEGIVPEQDVYLASSCTEEIAGDGGPTIVKELVRRGVKLYMVCDEGGAIVQEPIGGVNGHFAMIGVLEKGIGTVKLTAKSNGGHSSYPPKNSPIARLAAFVREMETKSPLKSAFEPEVKAMLQTLAPYGPFYYRYLIGNMWLFSPLVKAVLPSTSPMAAALLRTTCAFTMQTGSEAFNVLPQAATLTVNLRFIPHQAMKESVEAITKVAKKYDLEVELLHGNDFCKRVNMNGAPYKLVEETIHEVFPELTVCPYVMTGATDARFFDPVCDDSIRFSPVVFGKA